MNHHHAPLERRIFTWQFAFFLLIACCGTFFVVQRFMYGIGSVTNMNNGYPFGIWIALDVVVGTALGCGGYAMALLVYVANRGEYHPLVRPALMASVFGYSLAGLSVAFDIGRYWQMYNMFLPKYMNVNSAMLEVGLCIATYTTVLWIEFAPTFLEKFGLQNPLKILNKMLFFFIALGVLLPTMHQSSLGTLMIIAGYKLSPLWQTPWLPLLFLLSALCMGYGIVIFEGVLSQTGFRRPAESVILTKVSRVMNFCLGLFISLRLYDLIHRDALGLAVNGTSQGNLFLIENILLITAFILLLQPSIRAKPALRFLGGVLVLAGSGLFRFNTYITGFDPLSGAKYFPATAELTITLGIVALEIMAYLVFVKTLPVLPSVPSENKKSVGLKV